MENYQRVVKYYECDRMGITHHSNYIRFMEDARIYVLDQLGYGFEKMEAEGVVSPVVSIEVEYKKPTTFKDVIEIEVKTKEISPLKISFSYTMKVKEALVCKATSTHCFLMNSRPIAFQQRWPELVEKLLNL